MIEAVLVKVFSLWQEGKLEDARDGLFSIVDDGVFLPIVFLSLRSLMLQNRRIFPSKEDSWGNALLTEAMGCPLADRKNSEALLQELSATTEKPMSLFLLGIFAYFGILQSDKPSAFKLFQEAAQAGVAPAQCTLGVLYQSGDCVDKQDAHAALKWLKRAASQGHLTAQERLKKEPQNHMLHEHALEFIIPPYKTGWLCDKCRAEGLSRAVLFLLVIVLSSNVHIRHGTALRVVVSIYVMIVSFYQRGKLYLIQCLHWN